MGIGPYSYSIGQTFQTEAQFPEVDSGTYLVVLKDQRDCADTVQVMVAYDDQYQAPTLPLVSSICESDPATLDIGVPSPPNLSWTKNGQLFDHATSILITDEAGSYRATIAYHDGCVLSSETTVSVQPKPVQDLLAADTICLGESFRIADVDPTLSYHWSNNAIGPEVAFTKSDVYDLTITNEHQCSIVKSLKLQVVQPIDFQYELDTAFICLGEGYQWNLSGADQYLWTTQDETISNVHIANPEVNPMTDQRYHVYGTNQCFDAELVLALNIYQDITGHVEDTTIIEGSPFMLFVDDQSNLASWTSPYDTDCSDCLETIIRPSESGAVTVEYEDVHGCQWRDTIEIDVIPLNQVYPKLINVITPNEDGRNDKLVFEGMDIFAQYQLKVFNQDGNLVYSNKNYQNNWRGTIDGDPLPEGVYYYILSLSIDDRVFQFDSDLTIVRD